MPSPIDPFASKAVYGGPDAAAGTQPDMLAMKRREAISASIQGTIGEEIAMAGLNRQLAAISGVGRSVDRIV